MSRYAEFQTSFTDPTHLIAALADLGYPNVECHEEPQTLVDYHGKDRPEKAHIIVRRIYLHEAANDVGFVRGADGRYQAIISEWDQSHTFTDEQMGRLKQSYQERRQIAVAKQKGYHFAGRKVVETEKGKTVQLIFTAR